MEGLHHEFNISYTFMKENHCIVDIKNDYLIFEPPFFEKEENSDGPSTIHKKGLLWVIISHFASQGPNTEAQGINYLAFANLQRRSIL